LRREARLSSTRGSTPAGGAARAAAHFSKAVIGGYGRAVESARKALPGGTVTFLFTDIEGSTPLLDRLGPERYRALLEVHRRLLRDAVVAAGGLEIRAEADSFFAAFPSADGAAAAAVAAQRNLAAHDWPEDGPVRVRVGLHTGEATVTGEDYVGLAVHRARRVCDAGHGGQVLASSATAELLRRQLPADVGLKDLGEVRLAGFEVPERLFQLSIEGLPDAFPEPRAPRPWREERPVLLERAEELAAVDAAIAGSRAGAGRLVAIEGQAGIGKTSLLAEARSRAADAETTVVQARGSELERAFSYGVVRQLFEPVLVHADPAQRSRLLEGAAAHAAVLFDPDRAVEQVGASEDAAFAQLHGLYWLTLNLAESEPLLIAIDDLQWADPPSLRWLAFLAPRRHQGVRARHRPPDRGRGPVAGRAARRPGHECGATDRAHSRRGFGARPGRPVGRGRRRILPSLPRRHRRQPAAPARAAPDADRRGHRTGGRLGRGR
jgi:class 3 adenylate cyclase